MSNPYYKTKESVEEYIQLAKDVNGADLIEKLKQVLPAGSHILELGSGPGSDWKILSKDFQVTGSDFSTEFLSRLKKQHPEGAFLELDASTLDTEIIFEGIYSNKVLHHLKDSELEASIQRQFEILSPGGIICHSFWKGEESEVFKGMFVNYHLKPDLERFFGSKFEILTLEPYQEFDEGDSLLLIGKRK